jgi:hypothetical protein
MERTMNVGLETTWELFIYMRLYLYAISALTEHMLGRISNFHQGGIYEMIFIGIGIDLVFITIL